MDETTYGDLVFVGAPTTVPAFQYRVDVDGSEWIRQTSEGEGFGDWCPLRWAS